MTNNQLLIIGIGTLVALLVAFTPAGIAFARQHPERRLIAQLSILSMFSFLLWFALIAWAVGGKRNDAVINRFIGKPGQRGRLVALVVVLVGAGIATTTYALTQGLPQ